MNNFFKGLQKGLIGILGGATALIGYIAENSSTLPIPSTWGPYIQIAGVLAAMFSHSPLPSKPDGK